MVVGGLVLLYISHYGLWPVQCEVGEGWLFGSLMVVNTAMAASTEVWSTKIFLLTVGRGCRRLDGWIRGRLWLGYEVEG